MRITSSPGCLVVAIAATLALAGCVQPPPHVFPTAAPSAAPVFKSDAEALAAAKTAYSGYSAASDAIGADGGKDPERIAVWVTPRDLSREIKVFDDFADTGDRLVGTSVISRFSLEQVSHLGHGRVSLSAYACDDVSGSRLLNSSGADVTPSRRKSVVPLEVRFDNAKAGSTRLLVDGSVPWPGANFCS